MESLKVVSSKSSRKLLLKIILVLMSALKKKKKKLYGSFSWMGFGFYHELSESSTFSNDSPKTLFQFYNQPESFARFISRWALVSG